jgi:DNA-binding SARP family transcriptional activator/class 3 adenylate cyclase
LPRGYNRLQRAMDFRLLGPLEVIHDGRTVALGGVRQRTLLAILLLRHGEVVPDDRLIDDLYGDTPPATARRSLHAHLSRLRKALGPELALHRRGTGYVLTAAAAELDTERFSDLLDEGQRALAGGEADKAVDLIEQALALWRGRPLADLPAADFVQGEVARLEEQRLTALECLADGRLLLGRHSEVIGELERLVVEHPHRERLHALRLLALYRAGRQADALEAYQTMRDELVDELGIEPGRALQDLQVAILNQDPGLDLAQRPALDGDGHEGPEPTAHPASDAKNDGLGDFRKTVTALSVSLAVSSTAEQGLDPETLRRVTGQAFGLVEVAVGRHGATVAAALAGQMTTVFGLPQVHEDDGLRAVRAAVDTREALAALAAEIATDGTLELLFRLGIGTGEVVGARAAGAHPRAIGEPLTRAAELSRRAASSAILVDEATVRVVRDAVVVEATDEGWEIVGLASGGYVGRLASPMVGRERERRRLHDAFDQAIGDCSCQLFTVLGVAGVGKSRLVHEFLDDIAGRAVVTRGRCLPYGEGITYWPLLEAITALVGLEDSDSPAEGHARLVAGLNGEPDAEAIAQRIAELVGLADGSAPPAQGFAAVRTLFETIARAQPLVLVFDDIHWGETMFLDLVEHLAEWTRDAPMMLVCLARPELLEGRATWGGGQLNATATLLEPLTDEQCALLIENLVGRGGLTDAIENGIAEAAEGNPLFVEEMIAMLIDDGLLVESDGRWSAKGDVAVLRVPPTIQALLAARLDRLAGDERAVLERAAIVGKVFYEQAVFDLSPGELRPAVADALGSLLRKELVRPQRTALGSRTYRFRHLLIRDAAYESIPKERRAELHEQFGAWLERNAGERVAEYDEVVGYHLEQAHRYRVELGPLDAHVRAIGRSAAARLSAAGNRALERRDAPAGLNLTARAIALLPAGDPLRIELVPNMRVVQGASDLAWAERVLIEAVDAAAPAADRQLAANTLVQRGFLRLFGDPAVTAAELIEAGEWAVAVLEEVGDELGMARAWRLLAQAHYLGRRLGRCAEASETALAHARRVGDRGEQREISEWLVIALEVGPAPVPDAIRRCGLLLEETDDELLQADILGALGYLTTLLGRPAEADALMGRARVILAQVGEPVWIVNLWFGWIHLARNDTHAAEHELRPGYEALKALGEKTHFSSFAQALAAAAYMRGQYAEADKLALECGQASHANDVRSQILWRSTRAKVLACMGRPDKAVSLAHEAVLIAADSDLYTTHADALIDLAEVLELNGVREAAATATAEACRLYDLKGNVLHAERARVRLTRLR